MTPHQRKIAFALCHELGWDDDMRHGMVARWTGGKSSLAANAPDPLTPAEASLVISNLRASVASVRRGRARAKKRQDRLWPSNKPTRQQLHAIARLRAAVFGDDDMAFRGRMHTLNLPEVEMWFSPADAKKCLFDLHRLRKAAWHPGTTHPSPSPSS